MIIENVLPFRFIDSRSFREFVHVCTGAVPNFAAGVPDPGTPLWSPAVPIFHRDALRRRLKNMFETSRARLRTLLRGLPSRSVSISMDEATDRSGYSYLGVMCHWVDADWNYRVACLDMLENRGGHSHAELKQFLDDVLQFYGIDPFTVTTDNASNFCKLGAMSTSMHVRCSAHVAQLAARDILSLPAFAAALVDVEEALAPLRQRSTRARIFRDLKLLPPPGPAPRACPTRWNSELRLVQHFLQHLGPYQKYMCSRYCPKQLSNGEFVVLSQRLMALKESLDPLSALTDLAQSDSPIFALVVGLVFKLLADWRSSDLLSKSKEELTTLWKRGPDSQEVESSVYPIAPPTVTSPDQVGQSSRKRSADGLDLDRPFPGGSQPAWACAVGTLVRAGSVRGILPSSRYKGEIQGTFPDRSVLVAFFDGDVERVPPDQVELLTHEMRSYVPLNQVYDERTALQRTGREKRQRKGSRRMYESRASEAAEYMWDDPDTTDVEQRAGRQSSTDSDNCDPSGDETDDEDEMTTEKPVSETRLVHSSDASGGDEESFDLVRIRSGVLDADLLTSLSYRRRAAAHIMVLFGSVLRFDSSLFALAYLLNPLTSAPSVVAVLSDAQRAQVYALAREALLHQINEEMSRSASAPATEESNGLNGSTPTSRPAAKGRADGFLSFFSAKGPASSSTIIGCHASNVEWSRLEVDRFWGEYNVLLRSSDTNDDILQFWHRFDRSGRLHPSITNAVRRHLSIPPSAAACERLFSTMTQECRGRPMMKPTSLRMAVFLKTNQWLDKESTLNE